LVTDTPGEYIHLQDSSLAVLAQGAGYAIAVVTRAARTIINFILKSSKR
jgi:hypothetical protein